MAQSIRVYMVYIGYGLYSPKYWDAQIVSSCNEGRSYVVVQQDERDEDVVQVTAMHRQEDEW